MGMGHFFIIVLTALMPCFSTVEPTKLMRDTSRFLVEVKPFGVDLSGGRTLRPEQPLVRSRLVRSNVYDPMLDVQKRAVAHAHTNQRRLHAKYRQPKKAESRHPPFVKHTAMLQNQPQIATRKFALNEDQGEEKGRDKDERESNKNEKETKREEQGNNNNYKEDHIDDTGEKKKEELED